MSKKDLKKFDIKDMENALKELSKIRPIFHNERDFQFELAWLIKEEYDCDIRHEYYYKTEKAGRRIYIDLIAYSKDYCIAFELKYKTKIFNYALNGEKFDLKEQDAQDEGSASVLSDLSRTEKLIGEEVNGKVVNKGFVVLLTNDEKYKKGFQKIYKNFSLIENREINGKLEFVLNKPIQETGAKKFAETDFTYNNTYKVKWGDYSEGETDKKNSAVYQLVFEVNKPN